MILALDVGNTHTVLGIFQEEGTLESHWRLRTDKTQTGDEFRLSIEGLLEGRGYSMRDLRGVIIGSVVPSVTEEMRTAFSKIKLLVVDYNMKFNFSIRVKTPHQVGADRLINAHAALLEHQPPLVIIDAGTATTFCYVDENHNYRGGSILPGLHLGANTLFQKASKLVAVEIEAPASVIGDTTESALQSGIVLGYASMIDGLIDRYQEELKQEFKVIATGGLFNILKNHVKHPLIFDKNLTLKGLWDLWKTNS